VNPKNTAANQGTGLGLAIVKKLANLHGGELQVQSTEGVGSKFTLNLSITPSEPQLASQNPPSSSSHLQDPEALNVLIVDDNSMNLMVAKKQIELLGHTVISAINGQEAIDQWKQHQPDFILMDLQMPVMDGMEATRQIRRQIQKSGGSHLPIVALTADAEESTREEALAAGLDMVLVKPSDTETLRQAIAATTSPGKG
jgi:CheY-like chemotaxis protein